MNLLHRFAIPCIIILHSIIKPLLAKFEIILENLSVLLMLIKKLSTVAHDVYCYLFKLLLTLEHNILSLFPCFFLYKLLKLPSPIKEIGSSNFQHPTLPNSSSNNLISKFLFNPFFRSLHSFAAIIWPANTEEKTHCFLSLNTLLVIFILRSVHHQWKQFLVIRSWQRSTSKLLRIPEDSPENFIIFISEIHVFF